MMGQEHDVEAKKAEVQKACEILHKANVHLATRIMSGEVVLYREPKPRYKKDGTRAQTNVTPWADLNKEQARAMAFLLLNAIDEDFSTWRP